MKSGTGTLIFLAVAVPAAGIAAWWLVTQAPYVLEAKQAERRSPPRGTIRKSPLR